VDGPSGGSKSMSINGFLIAKKLLRWRPYDSSSS
jgi:hypothetical protein